jgi:hypothetical protein
VSAARRNLKKAAGKALARRTGTAYEASVSDEKAHIFKVPYLDRRLGRICGDLERFFYRVNHYVLMSRVARNELVMA